MQYLSNAKHSIYRRKSLRALLASLIDGMKLGDRVVVEVFDDIRKNARVCPHVVKSTFYDVNMHRRVIGRMNAEKRFELVRVE